MVVITDPLPPVSEDVEDAVYRIALEAVTNALRHASADHIAVELVNGEDGVFLTVRDDGIGIPPDVVGGVGLTSMRSRTRVVGGRLAIESGEGTTVRMYVPHAGGE